MATLDYDYVALERAASTLGVPESTLLNLVESGRLPAVRLGESWLVSTSVLLAFLREEEERQTRERRGYESLPVAEPQPRSTSSRSRAVSYTLLGERYTAPSAVGMLVDVLREFARRDPAFLERFSLQGGRARRYVARTVDELYPGKRQLHRFAKVLVPGWLVATNFSAKDVQAVLHKACDAMGLVWGLDLVVHSFEVDREKRESARQAIGMARGTATDVARRHDEYFAQSIAQS